MILFLSANVNELQFHKMSEIPIFENVSHKNFLGGGTGTRDSYIHNKGSFLQAKKIHHNNIIMIYGLFKLTLTRFLLS